MTTTMEPINQLLAPLSTEDLPELDINDTLAIKKTHFPYHEQGVLRLNHGSFGAPPKCVVDQALKQYMRFIAQPDKMYFNSLIGGDGVTYASKHIAELLNYPDPSAFTLVENATTAAVIVAKYIAEKFISGQFSKGDVILMFDTTYNAVINVFTEIVEKVGGKLLRFPNPFPVESEQQLLDSLQTALTEASKSGKIRLVVLDHITSVPTILMPIVKMVKMCHEFYKHGRDENEEDSSCLVFVDGAHAIGNCPSLDLKEMNCDFYCSNIHKWMFAPPGVAFFFAKPTGSVSTRKGNSVHHPIVSHNYRTGLQKESNWVGTKDYSSYLVVPHAIQFYLSWNKAIESNSASDKNTNSNNSNNNNNNNNGVENEKPFSNMAIYQRNHALVVKAASMLSAAFKTPPCTPDELMTSMAMVQLPDSLGLQNNDEADAFRSKLRAVHSMETVIWVKLLNGKPVSFARISAQIYNQFSDYEALRDAILLYCSEKKN